MHYTAVDVIETRKIEILLTSILLKMKEDKRIGEPRIGQ